MKGTGGMQGGWGGGMPGGGMPGGGMPGGGVLQTMHALLRGAQPGGAPAAPPAQPDLMQQKYPAQPVTGQPVQPPMGRPDMPQPMPAPMGRPDMPTVQPAAMPGGGGGQMHPLLQMLMSRGILPQGLMGGGGGPQQPIQAQPQGGGNPFAAAVSQGAQGSPLQGLLAVNPVQTALTPFTSPMAPVHAIMNNPVQSLLDPLGIMGGFGSSQSARGWGKGSGGPRGDG